jgi:ankyrin repeat protein
LITARYLTVAKLLRPDQEKEIMWEHQSQILQDFEQISKRHKSPDEAAAAAFQVAMCYLSGFGTKKDLRASANLVQKAEERNHPAAKLFGHALKCTTSNFKKFDETPSYDTRVIRGLKSAHNIGPTTSLAIQWKSLDSKPLDLSQTAASRDLPPQYHELTSGDIVEYSAVTKVFQNYAEFRNWLMDCAKDETEPFLLSSETSVTTVPPSFKTNLVECAIIREDTVLVNMLSKHISMSTPGYLGDLPLIIACQTGNMDIIRVCLAGKSNLFEKQPDGSTFFHWIFMLGTDMRYIFESSKFSNRVEDKTLFDIPCLVTKVVHPQWPLQLVGSPLAFSISACSFAGIAALLRLGANPLAPIHDSDDGSNNWWTPLHLAVKYHSPEMLVLLLLGLPKYEADLDAGILASVKARLAKIPHIVELLGGKKSPLTKALTKPRLSISFTDLWDATIGCALSYSTTVERIAIHGTDHEGRLAEIIALLPSSCLFLSSKVGKTPLMQAIDFNDLSVMNALLKRFPKLAGKAFLDPLDGQFTFPIHFASQIAGRRDADDALDILQTLVEQEEKLISIRDSRGKTPLHYSVTGSSDRATKWLIEKGCSVRATDDQGQSALHSARSIRNLVTLLDAGCFIDQQDKTGKTPIHIAVAPGSEDFIKILVDRGANLNLKDNLGKTAIHYAIMRRSRDVCAILLEAGADANSRTNSGDTPLHLAIQSTRSDIVRLLLDHGANISTTNADLFTPLHQSVVTGDFTCFNRILGSVQCQDSALVNAIDVKQQTPLHIAAKSARINMAEKLLQHGAKADMVDEDGNTAFHLAVESDPRLGHTQADKVDFLALLYSHWATTCGSDVNKTDLITTKLNTENLAGKTAWDLAYQQKAFMLMDFLIVKGGFDVCRQLQLDGEYIGNRLLNCAIDVDEWDLVITLLRHETVLDMHPILKHEDLEELYMALRMNDKWSLKKYLRARMSGDREGQASGLEWLDGKIAESELFRPWKE